MESFFTILHSSLGESSCSSGFSAIDGEQLSCVVTLNEESIISKNKYKFLDGTLVIPNRPDPQFDYWEQCNNLVHFWLMNSFFAPIAQSIVHVEIAADAWRELKERLSQGDLLRVVEFQQELYSLKQNFLFVIDYFTELKALWEELENYRLFPNCVCIVRCTCESMCNARLHRQQDYMIKFLMGLTDDFIVVRSQVLLMDPLPPLNRVFSIVAQHECQYGLNVQNDNDSAGSDYHWFYTRGTQSLIGVVETNEHTEKQ